MQCKHRGLRFHSGGHFIACTECGAWWCAVKDAHTPQQDWDFSRAGNSDIFADTDRVSIKPEPPQPL